MTRTLSLLPLFAALATPALADMPKPEFFGEIVVPSALSLNGVTFGGISDLSYDAATDRLVAISDDRAQNGPARFYELKLTPNEDHIALDIIKTVTLTDLDGSDFAVKAVDPEGIAIAGDRIIWSSERDASGAPKIFAADMDGKAQAQVEFPDYYLPNADKTKGIYNNQGHEGLTMSPDGTAIIAATESGLIQDGPKASLEAGGSSRIMVIDAETLAPKAEYMYKTESIATKATQDPFWNDNGVSAIAALDENHLVTVERSYAHGVGNAIRFFITDLSSAENILGTAEAGDAKVAEKTLWFTINEGDYGLDIDNIESFTFGPEIDGATSFIIASDDNFNPASQFTQFAVFTLPGM